MNIFLSYSNADAETAIRVANTLRGEGYSVFFDRDKVSPGDAYSAKIVKAIESSRVFVFLVSEASVAEKSFPRLELSLAQHQASSRQLTIVPVLLQPITSFQLPPEISHLSAVEAFRHTPTEVLAAIRRIQTTRHWIRKAIWLAPLAILVGLAASFLILIVLDTVLSQIVLQPIRWAVVMYVNNIDSTIPGHMFMAVLSSLFATSAFQFAGEHTIRRHISLISPMIGVGLAIGIYNFNHLSSIGGATSCVIATIAQALAHLVIWRRIARREA